ncbi:hypothetical protein FBU59_000859 [Linderina macrospora]|uniref:Uncharacterized protein n=1 Tax=Linderina macrospora TaxID=4868 RepID=A0ACC1JFH6_9FUNG|nr:hypothetical protein FBU59_000859 [Linderina macrospora]
MLGGRSLIHTALALTSLSTLVAGLFPDEAGRIDWYRAQIGAPMQLIPHTNATGSTNIYTVTDRNVLASLNSQTGDIVWRQVLGDTEPIQTLKLRGSQLLTHSGFNSSHVRVWDAHSGSLQFDYAKEPLREFQAGSGTAEFLRDGSSVVAVVGDSVVRLDQAKSAPVWQTALNQTGRYTRIVVQDKSAFVLGDARLVKRKQTKRVHVIEVDLESGLVKQQYDVAEGRGLGSSSLVVLESRAYGAYVVWREEKNIVWQVHRLGLPKPLWEPFHAKVVQVELMPPEMLTSTITELDQDPGVVPETPRFVMRYTKDDKQKAVVVEMFRKGDELDMRKFVGFRAEGSAISSHSSNSGSDAPEYSVLAARSLDSLAWRVYRDNKKPTHTGEFKYDTQTYGAVKRTALFYAGAEPRVLVQTQGGLLAAFAPGNSEPIWFRDESLAHANDMAFLELQSPPSSAEKDAKATDPEVVPSAMARFVLRWIQTFTALIDWTTSGFGLFASSSESIVLPPASVAEAIAPAAPLVQGDHFGFRKLSVFGTSTGVVAAINTQSGARSWTFFVTDDVGAPVNVEKVFVTRRTQPLATASPLVTAVGRSAAGKTVVVTLDALTGLPVDNAAQRTLSIKHTKVLALPYTDPTSDQRLIGLVVDGDKPAMHLWPATETAAKEFCASDKPFYFDLGDSAGSTQLRGYYAKCDSGETPSAVIKGVAQFAFDLPAGESLIKAVGYDGKERTALMGRVLGDRSVLYKYLNPHLLTLATQRTGGIGIYFIDRVSGRLLHSAVHDQGQVSASKPFLALQTESRVIYQFWQDGIPDSRSSASNNSNNKRARIAKGYVTVVAELFESDKPDTRGTSKEFSSFDVLMPHVISTAFTAPEPASALGVTGTTSHITTRDVLFGLQSSKLLSLPDQVFDPRRPKKAPTKDEEAEGLMSYGPLLPMDPKRVLSYSHSVAGIRTIRSAPTHLESTSLVAAYGLDLFFTRTSPSGTFDQLSPSFSKINLVVTTLALTIGCVVGGPLVRRKATKQAWA